MRDYLIGCDPELFVVDNKTKAVINAHGLIKGDKSNPFPVPGGAVQVDGMALEFNTDPASTREEFVSNVMSVTSWLEGYLAKNDLSSLYRPVAHFSADYYAQQPEDSKVLGCNPDFNAWTMQMNPAPDGDRPMRTAAGHVHIGWGSGFNVRSPAFQMDCAKLVRHLDAYIGVASVILDPDNTRREMYGKAGAYRPKPYGLEYRVPSNFWLSDSRLVGWMYDSVLRALSDYDDGRIVDDPEVQEVINSGNAVRAQEMLRLEVA